MMLKYLWDERDSSSQQANSTSVGTSLFTANSKKDDDWTLPTLYNGDFSPTGSRRSWSRTSSGRSSPLSYRNLMTYRIVRIWPLVLLMFIPLYIYWFLADYDAMAAKLPFGKVAYAASYKTVEEFVEAQPSVISICHPKWHGIRAATYSQGNPVLEVPGILSQKHQKRLLDFLGKLPDLHKIVINGVPPRMVEFVYVLKQKMPRIEILFVYHGSFSQEFHVEEAGLVDSLITGAKKGVIDRIGLVKNGMVETFKSFGVEAAELWNFASVNPAGLIHKRQRGKPWKIGIFGSSEVHKNIITQMAAACQFENAQIFVKKKPRVPYLRYCRATIVETGQLSHKNFLRLLSTMDITLYVSLTEAFPMTVVESISFAIPSLVSPTSAVYELDDRVRKALTVNELDSPDYIAQRIQYVMDNYDELSAIVTELVPRINDKALNLWTSFIADKNDDDTPAMAVTITTATLRDANLIVDDLNLKKK